MQRRVFTGGAYGLNDEEKLEIEEIRRLHEKKFCRHCDYCQPCREDILIQAILGVCSMIKRMGDHIVREGWRKTAIDKARNCSECGECMTRCPYDFPIPDLIKETLERVGEQPGAS